MLETPFYYNFFIINVLNIRVCRLATRVHKPHCEIFPGPLCCDSGPMTVALNLSLWVNRKWLDVCIYFGFQPMHSLMVVVIMCHRVVLTHLASLTEFGSSCTIWSSNNPCVSFLVYVSDRALELVGQEFPSNLGKTDFLAVSVCSAVLSFWV